MVGIIGGAPGDDLARDLQPDGNVSTWQARG